MPSIPLKGKTALVTGAARRIGRETALTLADEGVNVIVHYRSSEDEAKSLVAELEEKGIAAWTLKADFADTNGYETLIDRAIEIAGNLDILINNASEFPMDTLDDISYESFLSNMQVNAWAPFTLIRSFAHRLGRGKIVNLLDSRTRGYDWNHVGYILAKHTLSIMTRMCALHYAPDITVNAVAPGLILPPPGKDESYIDRMKDTVPLRMHGDPQDIADAISYLLKSDFLTGEVIFVDGGRHLKEYIAQRKNGE